MYLFSPMGQFIPILILSAKCLLGIFTFESLKSCEGIYICIKNCKTNKTKIFPQKETVVKYAIGKSQLPSILGVNASDIKPHIP